MTSDEMAQVLERAPHFGNVALNAAIKAGAAALRAMEWRDIAEAKDHNEHGILAGHWYKTGEWHSDTLTARDTAIRLMHTHFIELPAPPKEGV